MKNNKKILFIGESPMLLNCVLFASNFFNKIIVITKDKKILKHIPKKIQIFSNINKVNVNKFDFLFSIMNKMIINKKIIQIKKITCLNFHDAYLPNYAGLYTSSWSILNGEKNHGVTWHKITNNIDQGDILLRKKFKIASNDTAMDIDNNSITIGFYLFKKIILKILENKKLYFAKQNLKNFKYFGHNDRNKIPNYGFINLNNKINSIFKIYKALNVSKQKNNKFCKMKLLTNKGILVVKKIELIRNNVNYQNQKKMINLVNDYFILKKNNKYIKIILEKKNKDKNNFKIINTLNDNLKKYLNYGLQYD
jgi:methionyl-tRNA formyltransferase